MENMSKGSILLINPWIYDFAAYNYWIAPLGLLSIAAVLRKEDYNVSLIDCVLEAEPQKIKPENRWKLPATVIPKHYHFSHLLRKFRRYGISAREFASRLDDVEEPDAVLVTSKMTYWYPGVIEAIRLVRKKFRDKPVILGGTYATLCSKHAAAFSGADLVITGEAEHAALRAVDTILFGKSTNWASYHPKDLDHLPVPALDLLPLRGGILPYAAVLTSRGCPMKCAYCASGRLQPGFRRRKVEAVYEEILKWHKDFRTRDFVFYDDALLYEAERHFMPLMERIIKSGVPLRFHTPNGIHARFVTPAVAKLMHRANFVTVHLGLETVNRKRSGKVAPDLFARAVKNLKEAGFSCKELGAYIMAGMPGQEPEEVRQTIKFVHDLGIMVRLSPFSPVPGTELGKLYQDYDPLCHNNTLLTAATPALRAEYQGLVHLARQANQSLASTLK